MMLIEGEAESLEFLANLILATAKYQDDCSYYLGPKMSGSFFFSGDSSHGIYIHRLPCMEKPGFKMAKSLGE